MVLGDKGPDTALKHSVPERNGPPSSSTFQAGRQNPQEAGVTINCFYGDVGSEKLSELLRVTQPVGPVPVWI